MNGNDVLTFIEDNWEELIKNYTKKETTELTEKEIDKIMESQEFNDYATQEQSEQGAT